MRKGFWPVGLASALAVLALLLVIGGCQYQQTSNRNTTRHTISVYGFSVVEEVMTDRIFPAFKTYWQQQSGEKVTFVSVFAGSEQIVDSIVGNTVADVAIVSNEQHAIWLRVNDQVKTDWRDFPCAGVVSRSPLVIVVRPGNPLGIMDWPDLALPGVKVIHPDPELSGGAQWALLAEYGSALMTGASRHEAQQQLKDIWANVLARPPSSREALRQFMYGKGDVLVTYEQDALLAQSRGAALDIVIPPRTIMSEHLAVIVDRNVPSSEREVVEAFVAFLWSETSQRAFTHYFFRAANDDELNAAVAEFHEIQQPFTVSDLGGWGKVYPEILNGVWQGMIAAP